MHLFKLDTFLYKIYKNKWKLEEEDTMIPTFTPPKLWNLNFENNSHDNLILYKYPSHYSHMTIFQYDYGFFIYFSIIGTVSFLKALKDTFKKKMKSSLFFSCFAALTFFEGHVISRRVRDVKSIHLKNGKFLSLKTFQDGDMEYQMDIKDFKVVNKHLDDIIILIDKNQAKNKNFLFFFMEPTDTTIYNRELFNAVLLDKRYLNFNYKDNNL